MADRSNYTANPAAAIATSPEWRVGSGTATLTRLTGLTLERTTGVRATCGAAGRYASNVRGYDLNGNQGQLNPAAGQVFTASATVRFGVVRSPRFQIQWFTAAGGFISATQADPVGLTSGAWTRLAITGTAPANTGRAEVVINDLAGVVGDTLDMTMVLFELAPAPAGAYFDGDSVGGAWLGAVGQSQSTFTEAPPDPLLWVGDLETGDLSQFRDDNPGDHESPNESEVVASPVRDGGFALRSTVSATTTTSNPSGQQRAERETQFRDVVAGDELWFAQSVRLLPGFPISPGTFQLVTQWKNRIGGSPPLALHVENGDYELQGGFGYPGGPRSMPSQDLGPAVTGVWVDWLWHVRFEEGPDAGTVSIWRNGVQLLTDYVPPGGTLYPGSTSYLKIGLYRGITAAVPAAVVHDEMRVGTTREAVEIAPLAEMTASSALLLGGTAATESSRSATAEDAVVLDAEGASSKIGAATTSGRLGLASTVAAIKSGTASGTGALALGGATATARTSSADVETPLALFADVTTTAERAVVEVASPVVLATTAASARTSSVAAASPLPLRFGVASARRSTVTAVAPLTLSGDVAADAERSATVSADLVLTGTTSVAKSSSTASTAPLGLDAEVLSSRDRITRVTSALPLAAAVALDREASAAAASGLTLGSAIAVDRVSTTSAEASLLLAADATGVKAGSATTDVPIRLGGDVDATKATSTVTASPLPLAGTTASDRSARVDVAAAVRFEANATTARTSATTANDELLLAADASTARTTSVTAASTILFGSDVQSGLGLQVIVRSPLALDCGASVIKRATTSTSSPLALADGAVTDRASTALVVGRLLLAADLALDTERTGTVTARLLLAAVATAALPPVMFPPRLGQPVVEELLVVGRPSTT